MGSVEESLKTEVIVNNRQEVVDILADWYKFLPLLHNMKKMVVYFYSDIDWAEHTKRYKELGYNFVVCISSGACSESEYYFPVGLASGEIEIDWGIEEEDKTESLARQSLSAIENIVNLMQKNDLIKEKK